MGKEEPAWTAELRGTLESITEWAFEKGPGLTEVGMELVAAHIRAAEQRGFQAGVNKTGDSVGKLRAELKTARDDARREAAAEIRESDVKDCCEECAAAVQLSARVIDPDAS